MSNSHDSKFKFEVDVQSTIDEMVGRLNRLPYGALDTAVASALNEMAKQAKTQAARKITGVYNMKVSQVKEQLRVMRADQNNLFAAVWTRKKKVPVYAYPATQVKTGTKVRIKRGAAKTIQHAFIATTVAGRTGVYARFGEKKLMTSGRYKGKYRQPIRELYTAGVGHGLVNEAVQGALHELVAQKFSQVLESRLEWVLMKRGQDPSLYFGSSDE